MGNPRLGTLQLSDGLRLPQCNPSFLWSDCSRYLAVNQYHPLFGLFFRTRMVIVDCTDKDALVLAPHAVLAATGVIHGRQAGRKQAFRPTCERTALDHARLHGRRDTDALSVNPQSQEGLQARAFA